MRSETVEAGRKRVCNKFSKNKKNRLKTEREAEEVGKSCARRRRVRVEEIRIKYILVQSAGLARENAFRRSEIYSDQEGNGKENK